MADPIGLPDPNVPPVPVPVPAPAPAPAPSGWSIKEFASKNWRPVASWLGLLVATILFNRFVVPNSPVPLPEPPAPIFVGNMGWHEPTDEEKAEALKSPGVFEFSKTAAGEAEDIRGDADGNAFNHLVAYKGFGSRIPTLDQGSIGSCVGNGWAQAINYMLSAMAFINKGPPVDGTVLIPAEVVYGGSRVNANNGRSPLFGDGSNGSWAARFVSDPKGGVCARGVYGPYDVSSYSVSNCRTLGRTGVKGELLTACNQNQVSCALVNSADDIEKALKQMYFVAICSDVGFGGQSSRDADGFLHESGTWGHCMMVCAYRKDKDGFLILNSWGDNWVGGPTGPGDPPKGSFWITRKSMDRIAKQGDSYAVSNVKGFPRRKIGPDDWIVTKPKEKSIFEKLMLNGGSLYASVP